VIHSLRALNISIYVMLAPNVHAIVDCVIWKITAIATSCWVRV